MSDIQPSDKPSLPTPETDALLHERRMAERTSDVWDVEDVEAFAKHARQLERQRDEANEQLSRAVDTCSAEVACRQKAEQQLDACRLLAQGYLEDYENLKARSSTNASCQHEPYQGRCVHCNAPFKDGQPVIRQLNNDLFVEQWDRLAEILGHRGSVIEVVDEVERRLSPVSASNDTLDAARWRQAIKDKEFPKMDRNGGTWMHVDRISGVIHEYDTPEEVMDAAIATATERKSP